MDSPTLEVRRPLHEREPTAVHGDDELGRKVELLDPNALLLGPEGRRRTEAGEREEAAERQRPAEISEEVDRRKTPSSFVVAGIDKGRRGAEDRTSWHWEKPPTRLARHHLPT